MPRWTPLPKLKPAQRRRFIDRLAVAMSRSQSQVNGSDRQSFIDKLELVRSHSNDAYGQVFDYGPITEDRINRGRRCLRQTRRIIREMCQQLRQLETRILSPADFRNQAVEALDDLESVWGDDVLCETVRGSNGFKFHVGLPDFVLEGPLNRRSPGPHIRVKFTGLRVGMTIPEVGNSTMLAWAPKDIDDRTPCGNPNFFHPHVAEVENLEPHESDPYIKGIICLGNISEQVRQLVGEGKLSPAIALLGECLMNYNPGSPYIYLQSFLHLRNPIPCSANRHSEMCDRIGNEFRNYSDAIKMCIKCGIAKHVDCGGNRFHSIYGGHWLCSECVVKTTVGVVHTWEAVVSCVHCKQPTPMMHYHDTFQRGFHCRQARDAYWKHFEDQWHTVSFSNRRHWDSIVIGTPGEISNHLGLPWDPHLERAWRLHKFASIDSLSAHAAELAAEQTNRLFQSEDPEPEPEAPPSNDPEPEPVHEHFSF